MGDRDWVASELSLLDTIPAGPDQTLWYDRLQSDPLSGTAWLAWYPHAVALPNWFAALTSRFIQFGESKNLG